MTPRKDISFQSGGQTCRGWLFLPEAANAKPPVIVMGHGSCWISTSNSRTGSPPLLAPARCPGRIARGIKSPVLLGVCEPDTVAPAPATLSCDARCRSTT